MTMALLFNQSSTSNKDNVTLPPTGVVARTVTNGAMETQVVKLDVGGEAGEILVSAYQPVPVILTPGKTITAGQMVIIAAGTAQQLPSSLLSNGISITARPTNVGIITVGASTVTNNVSGTGNGARLTPGQSRLFSVSNANVIWINGTATNDSIDFGGS